MIPACAKKTEYAGRLLKERTGADLKGPEGAGRTHSGGWSAWAGVGSCSVVNTGETICTCPKSGSDRGRQGKGFEHTNPAGKSGTVSVPIFPVAKTGPQKGPLPSGTLTREPHDNDHIVKPRASF